MSQSRWVKPAVKLFFFFLLPISHMFTQKPWNGAFDIVPWTTAKLALLEGDIWGYRGFMPREGGGGPGEGGAGGAGDRGNGVGL